MIGQNAAAARVNASDDRGAVHVGRARINGVMIPKNHSLFRQLPQRRRVLFADEIRAHPVPHHDDNVALLARKCRATDDRR